MEIAVDAYLSKLGASAGTVADSSSRLAAEVLTARFPFARFLGSGHARWSECRADLLLQLFKVEREKVKIGFRLTGREENVLDVADVKGAKQNEDEITFRDPLKDQQSIDWKDFPGNFALRLRKGVNDGADYLVASVLSRLVLADTATPEPEQMGWLLPFTMTELYMGGSSRLRLVARDIVVGTRKRKVEHSLEPLEDLEDSKQLLAIIDLSTGGPSLRERYVLETLQNALPEHVAHVTMQRFHRDGRPPDASASEYYAGR